MAIKSPYPFNTIVTAITFNSRTAAIFYESERFVKLLGAKWVLVHAGEKKSEKVSVIDSLCKKSTIQPTIVWKEGNVVDVVAKVCIEYNADLLLAGAIKRENMFKFYLGSISREICRKVSCSVLLLTEPLKENNPLHRIIVSSPWNESAGKVLETAAYVASNYQPCELIIVKENRSHKLVSSVTLEEPENESDFRLKSVELESEMLETDLKSCSNLANVPYRTEILNGKPGFALKYFAQETKGDLLCISGNELYGNILDRIFTNEIEYILEDIPCALLIVKA